MKLSISMIVRGEESCLAAALKSVVGADELVVVDTSLLEDLPDRSMEIAAEFGAKIYKFPWADDYAAARNFSLSKCTGDWIYIIDADEELESGGIEKVRKAIEEAGDAKTIYVDMHATHGTDRFWSQRIFRKCPEVFWISAVHNYLSVNTGPRVDIKHYFGYSEAHKKDPDRALRILAKVLKENPKAIRETYYLAREYWYRKDYKTAIQWYEDYLTRAFWGPEMADAWLMIAYCHWRLNKPGEARKACLQAIAINADFREALSFMSDLSGPKNKERWKLFASLAENEDVLFVRNSQPKDSEYYNSIFSSSRDMSRYDLLLKRAAELCWGKVLDVCCGTGELSNYINDYHGIDFSKTAIADDPKLESGDVFAKDLYGYDTYVILEALEHLDDRALLMRLPPNSDVVFSVPSFKDPSHLRTYNEKMVRLRFSDLVKIQRIERFNWDGARWDSNYKSTDDYILLVRGRTRA